jgi:2-polyprenyl-3-methyl-5-hydroxy-6-metoxy-1,4-benzoquinol methylase
MSNNIYDKSYFEILQRRSPLQRWVRSYFFSVLHSYLKGNVLDVGCGIGELANHVQDKSKYFGIDVNPYCVNYLLVRSLQAEVGSVYEIPSGPLAFDVVVMSHVLEHLDDPQRAIHEISRVLKPSGYLILIVPMKKGFNMDPTHRIFYDVKALDNLAKENNYGVISISTFPLSIPVLGNFFYFFEYRMVAQKQ